ncbi:two-component regulator propeller domain-containing protein [Parapedobacter sp. 2B3]|uniref:hybrid sensor histidine kinase/response regulator transcription factor n=1 Tax=Parapedobacter sp. 2B3 TaxID=3342381 RepID=UPI0035B632FA
MWAKFVIAFILFLVTLPVAHGKAVPPSMLIPHHYTSQEGLIFDNVNGIAQDRAGFIWVATEDGLSRFDGKSFYNIKYDVRSPQGLAGNYIAQLYTDVQGNLWVTSRNGISKYDVSSESFTHFELASTRDSRFKSDVSSVSRSTSNNELWISSNGRGFYRFNSTTGGFLRYTTESLPGLSSNMVTRVYDDGKGHLWVGTQDNGVQVFAIRPDGLVLDSQLSVLQRENRYCRVHHIYEDAANRVWVATDNGLLVYDRHTAKHRWFHASQLNLPSNRFLSLAADGDDQLYVGMEDGGVYRFRITAVPTVGLVSMPLIADANYQAALTERSVPALFIDRDGNLWVGTSGDGLFLTAKPKYNFAQFGAGAPWPANFPNIRYYGLAEDGQGNLFVGTDGHGLFKFDTQNRLVKHYTACGHVGCLTDNALLYAYRDRQNRIWFGTYNGGLLQYRSKTDDFRAYRFDAAVEGFSGGNDVRVVFEDHRGQLWIGTNGGGLNRLNENTGRFTRYLQTNSGIPANDIRAVAEDRNGDLIVGTYGAGITFFDPQKEQFGLPHHEALYERLKNEVIFALHVTDDNHLWIATESMGLLVYDLGLQRVVRHIDERNGLASNTVLSIQFDGAGNCWLSTNKGLAKIMRQQELVFNFGHSSGIQSGIFNPNSALFSAHRNQLFFGGTGGLTYFSPPKVARQSSDSPVTLTGIAIFGQPVQVGLPQDRPLLAHALNETSSITLGPSQTTFTIHYSSLEYGYADELQFAYKLAGLDAEWNSAGHQRSATYRYLPPGEYTFAVGVESGGVVRPDSVKTLRIVVLPPWYRTWWAYLGYLAIATVIYAYYRRYRRQRAALKYELAIATIEREKEKEWNELKINFYTRLSHEFRSSLTLILNPVKDLLGSNPPPQLEPYVSTLHANTARLLRLADQALAVRQDELISENVTLSEFDVVQLIREVIDCLTNLAAKKKIGLILHATTDRLSVWSDREKLETIIFNLLFNAVKFTDRGGVTATVKLGAEGQFEMEVADTGCGVAETVGSRLFEQYYHLSAADPQLPKGFGVGLWLVKSLVELLSGTISYTSRPGHGTAFTIQLPPHREAVEADRASADRDNISNTVARTITRTATVSKILVVEDDLELAKYLKSEFETEYTVWLADNESDALEIVAAEMPDIIVCDIMLAGGNGLHFCQAVRQNTRWKHIPVLLMTATKGTEIQIDGIENGADDILVKPFDKGVLQAKVKALLQRNQNLRDYFLNHVTDAMGYQKIAPEDKALLDKCIAIVESRLTDDALTVQVLADECGMTYATLSNRMKEINQQTPNTLIRTVRLHKAAQLLLTTDATVYEVAYQVGIKDLKYFREQFAKLYRLNPSEFVKKYRKPFHETLHSN